MKIVRMHGVWFLMRNGTIVLGSTKLAGLITRYNQIRGDAQ